MSKLLCKQVTPEKQGESLEWYFDNDYMDYMIFGNGRCVSIDHLDTFGLAHDGVFGELSNLIDEYTSFIATGEACFGEYENKEQIIEDYIDADLTEEQIKKIGKTITKKSYPVDYFEELLLVDILNIITGKNYEFTTIRGACQGSWQNVIYDTGAVDIKELEACYFNTGTEWMVYELEEGIDIDNINIDNIDSYSCENTLYYSACIMNGEIKLDIAEAFGVNGEDCYLYTFEGWEQVATYKLF